MKFNFYEGFYRLFIFISLIIAIFAFGYSTSNMDIWLSVLCGLFVFIICYLSFFIIEWIVAGFTNNGKIQETGLKMFFKKGINKFVNINYTKPFYFILILFIPLILIDIHNCNKTHEVNLLKDENEILAQKNFELENKNQELYKQNIKLLQKTNDITPTWGNYKQRPKTESIEEYDKENKLSGKDIEQMDKLIGQ